MLGVDVKITDTDFHPLAAINHRFDSRPEHVASAAVVLEDNVFLGAGGRVLNDVRIGRNSVIGAGSVVTRDIPSDVVAAGVPARVLGRIEDIARVRVQPGESSVQDGFEPAG